MSAPRVEVGDWGWAHERALAIREAVFVREQGVPLELEHDAKDPHCRHALAFNAAGNAVGTGRLLPDGHIGRMAVLAGWRGKHVGAALLAALIDEARRRGHATVRLHAQVHAAGFYARYGFVPEGGEYLEAGIAHLTMTHSLKS